MDATWEAAFPALVIIFIPAHLAAQYLLYNAFMSWFIQTIFCCDRYII